MGWGERLGSVGGLGLRGGGQGRRGAGGCPAARLDAGDAPDGRLHGPGLPAQVRLCDVQHAERPRRLHVRRPDLPQRDGHAGGVLEAGDHLRLRRAELPDPLLDVPPTRRRAAAGGKEAPQAPRASKDRRRRRPPRRMPIGGAGCRWRPVRPRMARIAGGPTRGWRSPSRRTCSRTCPFAAGVPISSRRRARWRVRGRRRRRGFLAVRPAGFVVQRQRQGREAAVRGRGLRRPCVERDPDQRRPARPLQPVRAPVEAPAGELRPAIELPSR